MQSQLAQYSALSQKDKGPAFISLLQEIISRSDQSTIATDLHSVVDTVVNQESVGLVVGRQVLSELVKILGDGVIKDTDLRKRVVEDTLATVEPRIVSYEEQVSFHSQYQWRPDFIYFIAPQVTALRFQLADIFEEEEEWSEAARVLTGISLDSGQR